MRIEKKYRRPVPKAPPSSTKTIFIIVGLIFGRGANSRPKYYSKNVRSLYQKFCTKFFQLERPIRERIAVKINLNHRSFAKAAANQCFREGVFNVFLQCSSQRSRAISPVGTGLL